MRHTYTATVEPQCTISGGTIYYTEPPPACSCGYAGQHLWVYHWVRTRFMRRTW